MATQRKDGRWEAKGIDPATGRRKSYYSRLGPSDADAQAKASYGLKPDDRTLYGYYATAYLPTISHRSENWKSQIGWAMDRYVIPVFGAVDLEKLTRQDLQRFFNRLTPGKIAPSSAAKVKIVLSGVLNLAESDGYIPRNPCSSVRLPTPNPTGKIALTFLELKKLYDASHPRLKPIILLCGFAGLRIGEACAMTRRHILGGNLLVRQQVLQLSGGAIITPKLKTPQSRADIPLPTALESLLTETGDVLSVYVAPNSEGNHLLPNNASVMLEEAWRDAGIRRVTPHELRHTFISLLENELECPVAVSAALARKTAKGVTAGYSHTHREQLLRWMTTYYTRAMSAKDNTKRMEG